jgi:serine/threonine-protein kinase
VPLRDYTTLARLGAGATGTVDAARHEPTGRLVAIKQLSPELLGDAAFLDRFRAEAAVLRTIQHPNIVALYEYVEEDGVAAIVMELVRGAPLERFLPG